jgi:hypothetical protein
MPTILLFKKVDFKNGEPEPRARLVGRDEIEEKLEAAIAEAGDN